MAALESLRRKIEDMRFRSTLGTIIVPHRSMAALRLGWLNIAGALLLPAVASLGLLLLLGEILRGWNAMFAFWLDRVGQGGAVAQHVLDLGHYMIVFGYPGVAAAEPTAAQWWTSLAVCVLLWLGTHALRPDRLLPLIYIVRACLLIQFSALAYFHFFPGQLRYDLPTYLADELTMALIFIFLVPWILGLTYNIFNFSLMRKVALTAIVLGYFLVAFPMQYLLHALALRYLSLLYLPLFYLVFGVFLDVMMFVALYAWGMSWRGGERAA
jgi:hypothetical protein